MNEQRGPIILMGEMLEAINFVSKPKVAPGVTIYVLEERKQRCGGHIPSLCEH